MKIQENIYNTNYHGHNYYEPARIIFCKQNAVTDKIGMIFTASTHNIDKRATASKAVELIDSYNSNISMVNELGHNHKAATQSYTMPLVKIVTLYQRTSHRVINKLIKLFFKH